MTNEAFFVLMTALLVVIFLIFNGFQKLIEQIRWQSDRFRGDLERLNDQVLDIRARLRDSDCMTDDEREEWEEQQRSEHIGKSIRLPLD